MIQMSKIRELNNARVKRFLAAEKTRILDDWSNSYTSTVALTSFSDLLQDIFLQPPVFPITYLGLVAGRSGRYWSHALAA